MMREGEGEGEGEGETGVLGDERRVGYNVHRFLDRVYVEAWYATGYDALLYSMLWVDERGWPSFHVAVKHGDVEKVRELLHDPTTDVNRVKCCMSALHVACINACGFPCHRYGRREEARSIVELLVADERIDVNVEGEAEAGSNVSVGGPAPLHLVSSAMEMDHGVDVMRVLLGAPGIEVNRVWATKGGGKTPLHIACDGVQLTKIKLLLQAGADPCMRDASGKSPLDCVCSAHGDTQGCVSEIKRRSRSLLKVLVLGGMPSSRAMEAIMDGLEGWQVAVCALLRAGARE